MRSLKMVAMWIQLPHVYLCLCVLGTISPEVQDPLRYKHACYGVLLLCFPFGITSYHMDAVGAMDPLCAQERTRGKI